MEHEGTPPELREGVRTGILASLRRDFELRGARTARRLVLAGVLGVAGALGATLLVAAHPFGHHAPWHVAVFSAVWAEALATSPTVSAYFVYVLLEPLLYTTTLWHAELLKLPQRLMTL